MKVVRHKFNAKACEADGKKFQSKKERNYYQQLKLRKKAGEVLFFLMQCPMHLESGVKYIVDFIEFHSDGSVHFVDIKGFHTQIYELKKRLIQHEFPITIEEV